MGRGLFIGLPAHPPPRPAPPPPHRPTDALHHFKVVVGASHSVPACGLAPEVLQCLGLALVRGRRGLHAGGRGTRCRVMQSEARTQAQGESCTSSRKLGGGALLAADGREQAGARGPAAALRSGSTQREMREGDSLPPAARTSPRVGRGGRGGMAARPGMATPGAPGTGGAGLGRGGSRASRSGSTAAMRSCMGQERGIGAFLQFTWSTVQAEAPLRCCARSLASPSPCRQQGASQRW